MLVTVLLLLSAGVALLVLGVLMMRRGLWPRRRGDEPRCGTCDYNLTGITSNRCPECGSATAPENVVYGQRHRRPMPALAGAGMIAAAACALVLLLFPQVRRLIWSPTMVGSKPSMSSAELAELDRRFRQGGLSAPDRLRLVGRLLDPNHSLTADAPSCVKGYHLNGMLTSQEQQALFQEIARVGIEARPKIALGEPVFFRLCYVGPGLGPGRGEPEFWVRLEDLELSLGGVQLDMRGVDPRVDWATTRRSMVTLCAAAPSPPTAEPARTHRLTLAGKVKVFLGKRGQEQTSKLCYEGRASAWDRVRILPADVSGSIRPIRTPSQLQLRASLRRTEEITYRTDQARCWEIRPGRYVEVSSGELPVGVAFQVYVRFDDKEYPSGVCTASKFARLQGVLCGPLDYSGPLPKSVDVILRASKTAALQTTNVSDYWDGEIVIDNVAKTWSGVASRQERAL